jgi:hypothetical protein
MTLLAIGRYVDRPASWLQREPTMTEILSDSIVVAVMKADGVDPVALEARLRSMAQNSSSMRQDSPHSDRGARCRDKPRKRSVFQTNVTNST